MSEEAIVLISMFGIAAVAVSIGIICITYIAHLKIKAISALAELAKEDGNKNGRT